MSQQEDDLRALAKIMDFLRAISIVLVVANLYFFTRVETVDSNEFYMVVDKILNNFNNECGLFANTFNSKLFAMLMLALSCFGTKGVKDEAITWHHIIIVGAVGIVVFLFNSWLLPLGYRYIYIITTILGYVGMLMSGILNSRDVIVVPTLAPIMTPIACESFMMPELTNPTTITVVADDD